MVLIKSVIIIIMVFSFQITEELLPCNSEIYCKGTMYDTIQDNGVLIDYVYNKLLAPSATVLEAFQPLAKEKAQESIDDFVEKYFDAEKDSVDTVDWTLPDKNDTIKLLDKINDRNLALFADHLIKMIPNLAIKGSKLITLNSDRYSLLNGDGFIRRHKDAREALYWDQYWVVNGLIMCEMYQTAKALIDSLISMVKRFGHVPRGNRIHYAGRSHPPLLTLMAYQYFNNTNDRDWLRTNIEFIDVELMYWVNHKKVVITKNHQVYEMYRYAVDCSEPRPENYRVDTRLAADMADKAYYYRQIHSASESGWDISARWLFGQNGEVTTNVDDLFVTRVVPVDLNAYLVKDFRVIAKMYDIIRDKVKQGFWANKAKSLEDAIKALLWNENARIWFDYDMRLDKHREDFFISNLMPLWASAYEVEDADKYGQYAVGYLKRYRVLELYKGGIPVSLHESQESFDFPNSYTHLQVMVLQGLRNTMNKEADRYASILFTNWLDAVLSCWSETKSVFDSYNSVEFGQHMTYNEWNEDYSITVGAFLEILADYYILDPRLNSGSCTISSHFLTGIVSIVLWHVMYLFHN